MASPPRNGILKALWLGILAFKKVIFFALIALAGSAKKLWDWIRGRASAQAVVAAATPPSDSPPAA